MRSDGKYNDREEILKRIEFFKKQLGRAKGRRILLWCSLFPIFLASGFINGTSIFFLDVINHHNEIPYWILFVIILSLAIGIPIMFFRLMVSEASVGQMIEVANLRKEMEIEMGKLDALDNIRAHAPSRQD